MTASNDFLDNLGAHQHEKMLREIANDKITPKKRDSRVQNDLYENINDNDFYEAVSYTHLPLPPIYSV